MKNKIIGVGLLFILIASGFGIAYVYTDYQYERDIGAYMENAYEVNTPELMIKNVELAEQGMRDAGLEETDYGAFIFKKPDNIMSFQYEFLENFNDRARAVITWREQTYGNASLGSETLGDVYEVKMDNLREFLKENGRADWIAEAAWWIENHLLMLFGLLAMVGFGVVGAVLIGAGIEGD